VASWPNEILLSEREKKEGYPKRSAGPLLSTKAKMGEMLVGLVLGRYGGVGHLHGRKVELRAHFKKATTLTCPFLMKNVSLRNNKIRRAKREEAKLRFWFKL